MSISRPTPRERLKRLIWPVLIYLSGVALFIVFSYYRSRDRILNEIDNRLYMSVQAAKNVIPLTFHDKANNTESVPEREAWIHTRNLSILAASLEVEFLYSLVVREGKAFFTIGSTNAEELRAGNEIHFWTFYPEASAELLAAEKSPHPIYETTTDRWGTFRSVILPFRTPAGNLYFVGADFDISYVQNELQQELLVWIACALFLGLLALPLYLRSYRSEKEYANSLEARVNERTFQLSNEITERKKIELQLADAFAKTEELAERAQDANRAKGEFLATMSHEIRTPLNVVIGMSTLLEQSGVNEEQADHIRMIRSASEHLLNLIEDVLDLSRIEARKVVFERIPFDVREVTSFSLNSFSNLALHKRLSLELAVDDCIPRNVSGDPSYLRQILFNLLSNAVKFTDSGTVKLSVHFIRLDPEKQLVELCFRVKDTGIGIPPEKQKIIFDRFSQADSSTRRRHGGFGLGLTISNHLVSLMGGELKVQSKLGEGSEFQFCLGFGIVAESGTRNEAREDVFSEVRSLNILLAEDNPMNMKMTIAILKKAGHTIDQAWNGKEVIEKLSLRKYDIVLMDVEMPGMDGIEATRIIRSGQEGILQPDIPIIALTAHAIKDIKDECGHSGMNDFLSKPLDLARLTQALQRNAGPAE